jgi:hypothetical protein
LAPKVNLSVGYTDRTEFILSTLYTITYLTYEEEKGTSFFGPSLLTFFFLCFVLEGHVEKRAREFAGDTKYTHLAWRLVNDLDHDEIKQLQNYLLFGDEKTHQ